MRFFPGWGVGGRLYKLYSLLCTQNEEEDNMLIRQLMDGEGNGIPASLQTPKKRLSRKEEIFSFCKKELI